MCSYQVKQGNIFGRVGEGFGKGLAEQVPQEIERYRLKQGLEDISQQKDLSPFQQFAKLSAIPGITPQMVQSGSELLKHQGIRQAYANKGNPELGQSREPKNANAQQNFRDVQFGGEKLSQPQSRNEPMRNINEPGQPSINSTNPTNPETVPLAPWTPEKRDSDISRVMQENPYLTLQEAVARSADNEARSLAQPKAVQEKQAHFEAQRDKAYAELDRQLETKLQKEGNDIYKDITGENKVRLQRLIERDLKENPDKSLSDIVNTRTNQMVEFARAKGNLNTLASRDFFDKIVKQGQTLDKLKQYSKIYREVGAEQEFFDFLKTKEGTETVKKGMSMSPQGAALVAFPLSKSVSGYIDKINTKLGSINSSKYAIDLGDKLTNSDSLLSIAKTLRDKLPTFSQREFFNQLREDQDNLRLNSRQKNELAEGEGDAIPDWGDIWILPSKKAHGHY